MYKYVYIHTVKSYLIHSPRELKIHTHTYLEHIQSKNLFLWGGR